MLFRPAVTCAEAIFVKAMIKFVDGKHAALSGENP